MINARNVQLNMKVIDRGYAGMCPNTFKEKRHFAIQDVNGVLKEEIKIVCTRKDLDRRLMEIRVNLRADGVDPSNGTRRLPWQTPVGRAQRLKGIEPVGKGWSCFYEAQRALIRLGVPDSIASLGGHAIDVFLTKQMHKEHLTNGTDMRNAFHDVFSD